jgi:hypothetical protein
MFLTASKVCMVEALRAAMPYNINTLAKAAPKRIDLEYPEDDQDWPALLVQFRPTNIMWSGLNPDQALIETTSGGVVTSYRYVRRCSFEGAFDLTLLALSSQERDRCWDSLIELFMLGKNNPATAAFHDTIENHDLIAMSILQTQPQPMGDSANVGTPWDPNALTYEATVRIQIVGQFWADTFDQILLPLSAIQAQEYIKDVETPPSDNYGAWLEVS